jgi:hypothetical protein
VLHRLAATIAPPERAPLYAALQVCIDLYHTLRTPVFARYGVRTDTRAEDSLQQAIVQHWAARRLPG